MKRLLIAISCYLISLTVISQDKKNVILIMPQPVSVETGTGSYNLTNTTRISYTNSNPEVKRIADSLSKKLSFASGYNIAATASDKPSDASGIISFTLINDPTIGNEGYKLNVTPQNIVLSANTPAGLFYSVQTLYQLLPKEIESKAPAKNISWTVPVCNITDYPRFGWRGLMLDVSRHFFTKEEVKQYINNMVKYKYNLLHLGLTNDEGWRIEIKGLPKLTEVGAWNVKRVGYFGTFSPPSPNEPRTYGGFYTQEDIRDLVRYAKEKFVNILPEINVPGHSLAAIAAYPELSCSGASVKPVVSSGASIKDWSKHVALVDDNLCPSNEEVYVFIDKVVTQVAQLFPFEYIHMGGDEVFKTFWERSAAIKALMKKEGLKDMKEVQSYFSKRVEKIVSSKGKKFIGWDEILEGGLAPGAAVMSWQGMKGGIEAAKMGHEVVMSPTTFAYLDYMQGDSIIEPRIYATLRLKKAYSFEPVPKGVDAKYIKGGQGNLWTEQVYHMRHAEYMTWPRGFAISESVWSPKDKKDWNSFVTRVEHQFKRFDEAETKYAPSMYDPIFSVSRTQDKNVKVELSTEVEDLDIYYTFDNTFPDNFSPKYSAPLTIPKEAVMLKLNTYRGKQPMGRLIYMPVSELQKRAGKK
jgi:hexosaminidase